MSADAFTSIAKRNLIAELRHGWRADTPREVMEFGASSSRSLVGWRAPPSASSTPAAPRDGGVAVAATGCPALAARAPDRPQE